MEESKLNVERQLVEGKVDLKFEHFQFTYEDNPEVIAVVSRGENDTFVFQFMIEKDESNKKIMESVVKELQYYLINKNEDNPWQYAKYHCNTGANIYSNVHWVYIRGRKIRFRSDS